MRLVVALTAFPAGVQAAHLHGRVVRVGFPASGQDLTQLGTDHYRPGRWTPVLVELTNDDGDLFDGRIEVRQADRDGDEVIARRRVAVRGTQRFFLYVPAGAFQRDVDLNSPAAQAQAPFAVRVFDADGKLAPLFSDGGEPIPAVAPSDKLIEVPNEDRVILDISARPVAQLRGLVVDGRLGRGLVVARSSSSELPDHPDGLDMADIIVWDAADPSVFDPAQRAALLQWTRRGGKLVLAVSKNWELLSKSRFGDVLPARLKGVATTTRVRELEDYIYGTTNAFAQVAALDPPLNYCPVKVSSLAADANALVPERPIASQQVFVAGRPCGRGEVVLVTTELRELFAQADDSQKFLRRVLGFRLRVVEEQERYGQDLFRHIGALTGFQTTGQIYIMFAFLFVVAYIAVVTGGSWVWLQRKKMLHHAWLAFALLAVVASGVSLGAVQLIRGFGQRVQELSIVDGRADSYDIIAMSYFGLKTASHLSLDVCVPVNWLKPDESPERRGSIRPLPAGEDPFGMSVYSAVKQYEVVAPLGELQAVPLRATVKQFEVLFAGEMSGLLRGRLKRKTSRSTELTESSWIENGLNTDLEHCYLFVRAARGSGIAVYPLGMLELGKRVSCGKAVAALQGEAETFGKARGLPWRRQVQLDDDEEKAWKLPNLATIHHKCLDRLHLPVGRADQAQEYLKIDGEPFVNALLVLSTYDEMNQLDLFDRQDLGVIRSQGQRLDCSSILTSNMALFVGFSEEPGPARLCVKRAGGRRWTAIQPETAHVVYRIAMPVENHEWRVENRE